MKGGKLSGDEHRLFVEAEGCPDTMFRKLQAQTWIGSVEKGDKEETSRWQITIDDPQKDPADVLRYLLKDPEIKITAFGSAGKSLEDYFMSVTG